MDFSVPTAIARDMDRFKDFLKDQLEPNLAAWHRNGVIPRRFLAAMGAAGWLGFRANQRRLEKLLSVRGAIISEKLAALSPGVAVAVLAHVDLGMTALWLFGSERLTKKYGNAAVMGELLLCLGNTEHRAGSDVANIAMTAHKVNAGWQLNGTKAYVTNGSISDMAVITAVSDPKARRNNRLSMFLVDLTTHGVTRTKLHKQAWTPSDLTRIRFEDVFVPDDHLMGEQGRGLHQVLAVFTHSRVPIAAIALGTAVGAFEMALAHARNREIFGRKIVEFQAKAFEIADLYAKIESARLMLWKACWTMDQKKDFRLESSMAKYLVVMTAREATQWAADLFGAASIILDHPVHKFPLDTWAVSLGEGTQDIQKLVIFRELMKRYAS